MTDPSQPDFVPGQRWASEAEPELGLGTVLQTEGRRVVIAFPSSGEVRHYSVSHAPLNRVKFSVGDQVAGQDGVSMVVEQVREQDGLLTYCGENRVLPEGSLGDQMVFNRPQDRLSAGRIDSLDAFLLRQRTLQELSRYQGSAVRGFLGGRLDLLPHQLYVVESVVQRAFPRVLLSDEIGLGKTIEACLVLHRKLALGRIRRALILVPSALVHQWFVELLRRFSLHPAIFDEERCEAIEQNPEAGNPFLDDQLVLCDIGWLAENPRRTEQAVSAGWDLMIVDEAHHLEWSRDGVSAAYQAVEQLAKRVPGLLLLTATPEEMGVEGHFARLRLLDPDRYATLEAFLEEQEGCAPLVPLAERLEAGQPLTSEDQQLVSSLGLDPSDPPGVIERDLIDRYGPGRVIFRNTRKNVKGFPRRKANLYPIDAGSESLAGWFAGKLKQLKKHKILAITHTREAAQEMYDYLKEHTAVRVGLFHEEMNLLQRDRQAAWFADPEGAQVLITSEIGGEGRNFQFAHHLVFLDVPVNPEVVEQRIGRLDRIGQRHDISLHVPFVKGSEDEAIARWLHEALDAFEHPLPGAHEIYQALLDRKQGLPKAGSKGWKAFLNNEKARRDAIADRVSRGRDRLLELNSFNREEAQQWVDAIRERDRDPQLQDFLLELFEAHGVHPEVLDPGHWLLRPDALFTELFPGFPSEGLEVVFAREDALAREDVGFITWDHPIVQGAIDRILASSEGTAAIAAWKTERHQGFLVRATFIVEATASQSDAHLYLPATPLTVMLDQHGLSETRWPERKELRDVASLREEEGAVLKKVLPDLLRAAEKEAADAAGELRRAAAERLQTFEQAELRRLKGLQAKNPAISEAELKHREDRMMQGLREIAVAPIRLDSLCLVWCLPV